MQDTQNATPKARHEHKYMINAREYCVLKARLAALCSHDGHGDTYMVRSLYFDSPDDRALREKLWGVSGREKFRLRYYNGDTGFIKLEKKSKRGSSCFKEWAAVPRERAIALISGAVRPLEAICPLEREFCLKQAVCALKPKTIVDYIREAYVYEPGNVRVTFDTDIRTGLYSNDLFGRACMIMPYTQGVTVLEVKYGHFLPDVIKGALNMNGPRPSSYSKYAAARLFG